MKMLKNWGRALIAALLIVAGAPAWAAQTGTAKTQAALYDSFCDQCGLPQNISIRNLIASVLLNSAASGAIDGVVIGGVTPAAGTFTTLTATTKVLSGDGTAPLPAYSFGSTTNAGMRWNSSFGVTFSVSGGEHLGVTSGGALLGSTDTLGWNANALSGASSQDLFLARDAANTLAQKNGSNPQIDRLYFSTTGPIYWQHTARTAGVLMSGVGGAAQVSLAQPAVPTCATNCGTSPTIAGTDTAGTITMGASGVPASGFILTFSGTWPAAPSCIVQSALTTMVVGKMPIAVQTATTTMTVTTNGTAPATSDVYSYHCFGVS